VSKLQEKPSLTSENIFAMLFQLPLKKVEINETKNTDMYFDQLRFLLKIFERDGSESTVCDNNTETQQSENDESSTSTWSSEVLNPSLGPRFSCARKRSRIPPTDETDKAILTALEAASQPPPPQEINEDTAFFL
jgi:hypothetical protein